MTLAGTVLLSGIAFIALAQLAIALHAFTGNPLKGILCFVLPMYVWVYARKGDVSPWYMRAWYAGVLMLVAGAVLAG